MRWRRTREQALLEDGASCAPWRRELVAGPATPSRSHVSIAGVKLGFYRLVDLQRSKGGNPTKKFVVLYMASGSEFEKMMRNSTPEQQKKGMDAWMKWMNANKASIVEGGAPLGKTKRVDSNGASNTKNEIGGYSVVQAESHDAATKIFGDNHPHLQMPGASIEIIEIMPLPGM